MSCRKYKAIAGLHTNNTKDRSKAMDRRFIPKREFKTEEFTRYVVFFQSMFGTRNFCGMC